MEIPFRVTQYLVERNYATYEETPALFRELNSLNRGEKSDAFLRGFSDCCWLAPAHRPMDAWPMRSGS